MIANEDAIRTYRDEIAKTNPTLKGLDQSLSSKPLSPFALGDASLEERPDEENGRQEHAADDIKGANGPPSQQLEGLGDRCIAFLRGDDQHQQGADDAGNTDRPNPCPDDGRRISTQRGRRAGG